MMSLEKLTLQNKKNATLIGGFSFVNEDILLSIFYGLIAYLINCFNNIISGIY